MLITGIEYGKLQLSHTCLTKNRGLFIQCEGLDVSKLHHMKYSCLTAQITCLSLCTFWWKFVAWSFNRWTKMMKEYYLFVFWSWTEVLWVWKEVFGWINPFFFNSRHLPEKEKFCIYHIFQNKYYFLSSVEHYFKTYINYIER